MKTRLFWVILTFVSITTNIMAGPRDAQWKEVDDATKKGLPKSAIELLDPIITEALADKAYAEAIKAIGRKIALEGEIQGGKPEEKIVRLQAELEKAPAAMKSVMEAILAHWYWQYFEQNRWRFLQRTQTAAASGPDLQTWDLSRILTEIDQHFSAALSTEAVLQAIPIGEYNDLLDRGTVPDTYRPTLFDFLAQQALLFYQAGEQAGVAAEEEFEVAASGPIFGDVVEFTNWQPDVSDSGSPKFKAIRLYQSLLKFHRSDSDRSAYHDADFGRLTYGRNVAIGETKDERYKAALQRFATATSRHEISARALAALATQLVAEGEPAKAHQLAQRGLAAFPSSAGGTLCFNLVNEIEARSAKLDTECVWNAPWPTLNVSYRNVSKVYFRAVALDINGYLAKEQGTYLYDDGLSEILAAKPRLTWEANLPPTRDFKQRTEHLPAPTSLKPGLYAILASHDPAFGKTENQISVATVWVSDLALVMQTRHDGMAQAGFVLDAKSGEPVVGATVTLWQHGNRRGYEPITPMKTDENGRFQFASKDRSVVLSAEHGGHAISSIREFHTYGRAVKDNDDQARTVFFTDRAIYRPGQTINYKGVSVRFDQDAGKYSARAGLAVTVVFNDPNGQEIARAVHRTNDYSSFHGVFTAPRDRLLGHMGIQVLGRPEMTTFSVEEYKRPKFQVELNAPTEAAKLDAPVNLLGKATAYTGAAIGGAKVKWRVERAVRLPPWCWWWQPPAAKAIAHGTALTEPDGTFKIQFNAQPDGAVPVKNEPTFVFSLHADVTDSTGETRSADRTVRAGYASLLSALSAEEWQTSAKPVELTVVTTSLDGDPQPANGTVTIHALKQPTAIVRAPLQRERTWWGSATVEPPADPSNPDSWDLGEVIDEKPFTTDATGKVQLALPLKAGIYRASLQTTDRYGQKVTARQTLHVIDPNERRYRVRLPDVLVAPQWSVEPGETFTALWGTGYDRGRAFVQLECNGKSLKSYWTAADRTQELVSLPVTEAMRGGVTVRVTYVRENRAYLHAQVVNVPWSNKKLAIRWESFRSKILPGQKETWTAVVTGPNAQRETAEMVAALYDASLDQYQPHTWLRGFDVFRTESSQVYSEFHNSKRDFWPSVGWEGPHTRDPSWRYRAFPVEILSVPRGEEMVQLSAFVVSDAAPGGYRASATMGGKAKRAALNELGSADATVLAQSSAAPGASNSAVAAPPPDTPKPDLSKIAARTNLNETAFFFPRLLADEKGVVKMEFTMPEALTEWKFLAFAHDRQLRAGFLTDKVVTAKDLMVEPNPPRFVREGDAIEFTVKVSNQSDQPQAGTVRLNFADAASQQPMDEALANRAVDQAFDLPAKASRSYSWRISVPDGMDFLTYKAVAASAQFSDGEEGFLPVLSRRILVTESIPLHIRGNATEEFDFKKLSDSGASDTLRHQSLTVQMVSQPAWYAVMALPYLMEYPYECSEQVFNRFYANVLGRHIANSDPKVRRIFDLWKATPALDSPLQKNQDLKSVLLEETPWLRQAKNESEARRNVGLLFDANRLDEETARALHTLSNQQLGDGLWPWFVGGPASEYISLYITTGFGRLRHLGVEVDLQPAIKSLAALDAWMGERYRRIQSAGKPEEYVPSSLDALYLYGRSFFLEDQPVADQHRPAVDFYLRQSHKFWLELNSRQSQAHLAIGLQRFGDKETAQAIMKSLKERSISEEEMGMYWRDSDRSWWWYEAPIETQAMMIEAFAEVTQDAEAVEDCKVWLLKQKQTQDWRTTKATADAIYSLLLRGRYLLSSDARVEVSLGGELVKPEKVEAGTGFYEKKFSRGEIKPAMGQISVKKVDDGVSWGGVHWQYLEDIAKLTPHEGTPLNVKKTFFIKEITANGQVLKPVAGSISVGDELVVRIELRTDREMEFVHLKDQRGSGTEPVNVLSGYKYREGLAYYETTRDTASHFFIDRIPRGVYVFEYSTRVQLRGRYQSGIAEIQCMYAPEFNSHSESILLEIE